MTTTLQTFVKVFEAHTLKILNKDLDSFLEDEFLDVDIRIINVVRKKSLE